MFFVLKYGLILFLAPAGDSNPVGHFLDPRMMKKHTCLICNKNKRMILGARQENKGLRPKLFLESHKGILLLMLNLRKSNLLVALVLLMLNLRKSYLLAALALLMLNLQKSYLLVALVLLMLNLQKSYLLAALVLLMLNLQILPACSLGSTHAKPTKILPACSLGSTHAKTTNPTCLQPWFYSC